MIATSNWRLYERLVAALQAENAGVELSITPNARIKGHISGVIRQVDVLIDARWEDSSSRRILVEAKYLGRKLNVKDVESFRGMLLDCNAQRGILVAPGGWSAAARSRAEDRVSISLLTMQQLEARSSWASFEPCLGDCTRHSKVASATGMVLWDGNVALPLDELWAVIYTGKCDVCHNFHVWCWDCGEKFAVRDEDEHICDCGRQWVTAVEEAVEDSSGATLNAVHLFLCFGSTSFPLDRRALR